MQAERSVASGPGGRVAAADDMLGKLRKGMPDTAGNVDAKSLFGYAPDYGRAKITDRSFYVSFKGRAVEIFITAEDATATDSDRLIPEGYRKITVAEGLAAWRQNLEFRQYLEAINTSIWTSQRGIKGKGGTGYYRIVDDDGDATRISGKEFDALEHSPQERLFQQAGSWYVELNALMTFGGSNSRGLTVSAIAYATSKARAAYTKDLGAVL